MSDLEGLPFVDEHAVAVSASRERTWAVLRSYVDGLVTARHRLLSPVLGTRPRSGFAVHSERPGHEVVLAGRHRFSTYRLVFRVEETAGEPGSRLSALTYAVFPGLRGWAYRTMLMVSTGHARATTRMLRAVARRAEA